MGRIIQHGDDLLVSAELVNGKDGSRIWGAQYNRRLSDVFVMQEQIVRDISQELRPKLGDVQQQELVKQSTQDLKALEYYMQGRLYIQRRTREDLLMAGSYFQKAIEEDPNYALAYTGLADVYANLGARGYISPLQGRRSAEESARKALAIDSNLAEGHMALGFSQMLPPCDFSTADAELKKAIQLKPSLAAAHLYMALSFLRQDRLDEGLTEMLKARELDPFSPIIARQMALYYLLKRDYPRSLQILRQTNEMGPDFTTTNDIQIYIQNRLYAEALTRLEKEKKERKDDSILIYDTGMVYAAQGRRAEALAIIKELEKFSEANLSEAQWIAKIYAALNEKDQAFAWLRRGLATGGIGAFYENEPTWDPLRKDPRFDVLLQQMGVPSTRSTLSR